MKTYTTYKSNEIHYYLALAHYKCKIHKQVRKT